MKLYSIGEFAKNLGVTPDFLKYYEKKGILSPIVNDSGYRLYQFWERGQVMECIKLRNCGFTSQEVVELLNAGSLEKYLEKIHQRQLLLNDQLAHLQAQMLDFDSLRSLSRNFQFNNSWEILNGEGFCFLPQADFDHFFEGCEVEKALKSWTPWMPTVKSTVRYHHFTTDPEEVAPPQVGFTVSMSFAKARGLYLDSPVEHVRQQRWLVIYLKDSSRRPDAEEREKTPESYSRQQLHREIARRVMQKHSLRALEAEYYVIKLLQLREHNTQANYSIMQIPIE